MFTELYREEKKEEGDRVARRVKEGNEKERDRSSQYQFLKCSAPSGTHRDSQSWVAKRRERAETEATWWRKRRVQRRREWSSQ